MSPINLAKRNINIIKRYILKKKVDFSFLVVVAVMGIYFQWDFLDILALGLFIWIILNPVKSRYLAYGALGLLSLIPVFLVFNQEKLAEHIAIYAYYFLIFMVMMAVYELKNEPKEIEKEK